MEEALALLTFWLEESRQRHVMTVNNEMLVESAKNSDFRMLIQSTALNVPDSTGLLIAASLTGQSLSERVPGVDLVQKLTAELDSTVNVFLLGAEEGIAARAGQELQHKNSRLRIVGALSGSPKREDSTEMIRIINNAQPQLLLVAFGAPIQDLWIHQHLRHLPSVRVAIGVGGTFDFLAGKAKRAPSWMRSIGLEWLWRVIAEPWRIPRIWRATVVFLWLVVRYGKNAPTPTLPRFGGG